MVLAVVAVVDLLLLVQESLLVVQKQQLVLLLQAVAAWRVQDIRALLVQMLLLLASAEMVAFQAAVVEAAAEAQAQEPMVP